MNRTRLIPELNFQFPSSDVTCTGTLMLPESQARPPVIVMAHGFANVRSARLPAFAERFVDAGYAAFLFDYRTFGESEGEPRYLVHPGWQQDDWRAAIRFVQGRPEIDPGRLVLWGTSYSGGHVLQLAAGEVEPAAVISQIPHVSGISTALSAHPWTTVKCTLAGLLDAALSVAGMSYYSAVIGRPGERAAITGDNAVEAYRRMLPGKNGWENVVLSRSFLYVPLFNPGGSATKITAPALIIAARDDSVVPPGPARKIARKIPNCTYYELHCTHFDPYFGESFERNVELQLSFLRDRVPV